MVVPGKRDTAYHSSPRLNTEPGRWLSETAFLTTAVSPIMPETPFNIADSVSDLDELTGALTRISEGGTVFDLKLVVELLGRARRADPLDVLTPREREVVGLMAEGQSNTGIAQTLWITHGAVEKHIKHIFN